MATNAPTDEITTVPQSTSSDDASDDDIEHQVDFIHKWKQNIDKNERVVIVTAGKAGIGKSTLINNFLQLEGDAAFEARLDPHSVTTGVNHSDRVINGVQVRVIDMPGLHAADSGNRTDTSGDILGDLKALTGKGADVVFYCFNLLNRLENVDFENLDTLTQAFGSEIWNNVIFVFTYTDFAILNGSNPEELVGNFVEALKSHLVEKRKVNVEIRSIYSFPADAVSEDAEINTFNGIVGIPVSKNPATPPNWRITLLLQVIRKCKKENIPAILRLHYIDWHEIRKSTTIVGAGGMGGAVVGTAVGAAVGAAIGGLATVPIGGVGALPTAAGGAAVGAWIGTISGSGSVGLTSLVARVVFVIRARHKIEKRARRKIKEMLENDKKIAQEASGVGSDGMMPNFETD